MGAVVDGDTAAAVSPSEPQWVAALARANIVRMASVELKREVAAGWMSFADAVRDDRSACLTVMGLLSAQPGWGRKRGARVCAVTLIPERKRCRDLTARQRDMLADAVVADRDRLDSLRP